MLTFFDNSTLENKLAVSHQVSRSWALLSLADRLKYFESLNIILKSERELFATLASKEMGKPLRESTAEVNKCIFLIEAAIQTAEDALRPRVCELLNPGGMKSAYWQPRPLGPVLGIMPWNFPYWQVFRFVVPTLISGNVVLVKHAENVFGCAEAIETCFERAGFPKGVYTNLRIDLGAVGGVISDWRIKGVSLTGSTRAGKAVAARAGAALKPCVLELGGSDAFIVRADANLAQAAAEVVAGRALNAGQSCISPKRIFVESPVYDKFLQLCLNKIMKLKVGPPLDLNSDLGHLPRLDLLQNLSRQIKLAESEGLKPVYVSDVPPGELYFPLYVFRDPSPQSVLMNEEIFGPVFVFKSFSDLSQLEGWVNQTPFGLGVSLFTNNVDRDRTWAEAALDVGMVSINSVLHSHPSVPFGGIKESGFGRELGSLGFLAFCNIKSTTIS